MALDEPSMLSHERHVDVYLYSDKQVTKQQLTPKRVKSSNITLGGMMLIDTAGRLSGTYARLS